MHRQQAAIEAELAGSNRGDDDREARACRDLPDMRHDGATVAVTDQIVMDDPVLILSVAEVGARIGRGRVGPRCLQAQAYEWTECLTDHLLHTTLAWEEARTRRRPPPRSGVARPRPRRARSANLLEASRHPPAGSFQRQQLRDVLPGLHAERPRRLRMLVHPT